MLSQYNYRMPSILKLSKGVNKKEVSIIRVPLLIQTKKPIELRSNKEYT